MARPGRADRSITDRDRQLIGLVVAAYETLGKTTLKNTIKLNQPTMALKTALARVEMIRAKLGTTGSLVVSDFPMDLRITIRDAVSLQTLESEKVRGKQEQMTMKLDNVLEYEDELEHLRKLFAEQLPL